jgi:hypothetical protein
MALFRAVIACAALQSLAMAAATDSVKSRSAAREQVAIERVQVGFGGRYKLGYWTPIRITIAADEAVTGRLEVTVPDSDGVPTTVSTDAAGPLTIPPGGKLTETLYIKPGQRDGEMRIRFVSGKQVLTEQVRFPDASGGPATFPPGLPATTRLLVVVGGEIGLAAALRAGFEDPAVATHVVSLDGTDTLPNHVIGWDAVDDVVLLTSDPQPYLEESFEASRTALVQRLEQGGRLYVFVGQSGDELLAAGKPLAPFVPGDFAGEVPLRQASAVEDLTDGRYSLRVPAGAFAVQVPHVEQVRGHRVTYGGNLPLIVRSIRGFGELVWAGLDVDRPPLADWTGRPELLRRVIGMRDEVESAVASDAGKLTSLGYTDLVGQLRAALDVFPGVRALSFAWVIGLTLLYLVLLGPLDYFLVHRWGRRPVWTWLTLPLFVLLVAGGAYGLAQASKGERLRMNQAEFVDVDLQSGLVRGTLWAHLYTPRHDRFSLTLRPQTALPGSLAPQAFDGVFSWFGLPGRGLGGLDATADGLGAVEGYRYTRNRMELAGLPLPIWTSKSLHGRWTATAEQPPIHAQLVGDSETDLTGQLTSRFEHDLTNARLYYRGRRYALGTLRPGQTFNFVRETTSVSAGNELRRQTTLGKAAPPYDPARRDARRVLQVMSWYDLAGGATYTGLLNRYESRLDFDHLLNAGRAVLIGETAAGGSQVILDDETAIQDPQGLRLVLYRVVIPVEPMDN